MHPASKIKEEHASILKKIAEIEGLISNQFDRKKISDLFQKFLTFWTQHERKEEAYLEWFRNHGEEFPYSKAIINEHEDLKGHWRVLQNFMRYKTDSQLQIALDTDGRMVFDKLRKHILEEEKYFKEHFRKF